MMNGLSSIALARAAHRFAHDLPAPLVDDLHFGFGDRQSCWVHAKGIIVQRNV